MSKFVCLWPGCQVEGRMWCLAHWGRLPSAMRERLRHAFFSSEDFEARMREAQEWAEKDEQRLRLAQHGWEYDL